MRLRVKPPEVPGEAARMHALRQQWELSARRNREIDRLARDPAERARVTARRLIEEGQRVLASIDATTTDGDRARLTQQAADLRRYADEAIKEAHQAMSRDKAKAIRKTFREKFSALAARYKESQQDKYPQEFREREGAAILREMNLAEATLSRDMLLWQYEQRAEASRLRQADPTLDAAGETRRLRETMAVEALTKQFPTKVQMENFALPLAREAIAAGNVSKAQVYYAAAQRLHAFDGTLERDIERTLDVTDPNRRKAIEIEVAAADELELSRRAVAEVKVVHKVGSPAEQVRASTALKLGDFKRKREAAILLEESGIELPAAVD